MENKVFENEKWWQLNGQEWVKEIENRRKYQPLYGVQEVVISSYLSKLPLESKVLEFGAGFGRHAEYIKELENIEYYAVDQSETMIEAFRKRVENKNGLHDRIYHIEPRTTLPFSDNYFDVVFTVSVLIHINPEHIEEVIKELTRVAKHVVFHFENKYVQNSNLQRKDHNGCWKHAIFNDYKKVNYEVKVKDNISNSQDLYLISLSSNKNYDFNIHDVELERLKTLGDTLSQSLMCLEGEVGWRAEELEKREGQIRVLEGEVGWRAQELEKREGKIRVLEGDLGWRAEELKKREEQIRDFEVEIDCGHKELEQQTTFLKVELETYKSILDEIYNSTSWKIIEKIKGYKFINNLAKKMIKIYKSMRKKKNEMKNKIESLSLEKEPAFENIINLKKALENIKEEGYLAVSHNDWLGVTNSTKELFKNVVHFKELTNINEVHEIAKLIISKNPSVVIFSGFAAGWNTLCKTLKGMNPKIKIIVFWHGNTTHMYEDYSWLRYQELLELFKGKHIDKWAFAKESMEKVYSNIGINSYFLKNRVEKIGLFDEGEEFKNGKGIKIGIYASGNTWNKNAYTQIAAASFFKNGMVNMVPYNDRMKVFAEQLNLRVTGSKAGVKREDLLCNMKENDLNLYVTFSECAPLLPLESLNQGVICITGPNHHYFNGSKLEEFLIVKNPDDPLEIYNKAVVALKNRKEIFKLYKQWYYENERLSKESVKQLLEEIQL